MQKSYLKYSLLFAFIFIATGIISCSGRPGSKPESPVSEIQVTETPGPQKLINIITPEAGSTFSSGQTIKIEFQPDNPKVVLDSVVFYYEGKRVTALKKSPWLYNYKSDVSGKTGNVSLKLIAYSGSNKPQVITRFITLKSDITPKVYGYVVVNVFPHDINAYTQGLVYDGNVLYEGTGITGQSDLRKVEFGTGKVLKQLKIDNQYFGEGIAILNDKIYQLTWQSRVGFVYKKETFERINKFNYQTEGWGLSVYNDKLVMSDGTNILYFIDPELFTVVSSIEVYDNNGLVDKLNELEVIDGEIWANIYMTNRIARIDPKTGKVIAYIDLSGILPDADRVATTDVLNGIAWDSKTNRIFVTGKYWPKMFEIRLTN